MPFLSSYKKSKFVKQKTVNIDKFLKLHDIDGHVIKNVYESQCFDVDGISISRCMVELENGVIFELAYGDFASDASNGLRSSSIEANGFVQFERAYQIDGCVGKTIRTIVCSDCWPSVGLLTCDGKLLFCSDYGTPFRVGPILENLGHFFDESDVMDYWTKHII